MTVTEVSREAADEEAAIARYFVEGEKAAYELGNRGPVRYDADGRVHPDILEAFSHYGFYVFTDVLGDEELAELRSEVDGILDRAPYPTKSATVDRHGRPALGQGMAVNPWLMTKPLSDPIGGTHLNHGRSPVKMREYEPTDDAPIEVPWLIFGCLETMPSFLRTYGHPDLLRVAEAIHGPDFTPFNEALFVKLPKLGPAVAWHQDGQIHWDHPEWHENIHGFNYQIQLYESTPANGVWVLPGSNRMGRLDIAQLVADNDGCERLPGAVPLVCMPGDAFITSRQTLHCSFPNTSPDLRITVNFGFQAYASVIDQVGVLTSKGKVYDEDYVRERCRCIALAIDARAQRFPDEDRYVYAPFVGHEDENRFTEQTQATVLKDYNLRDLAI